MKQIVSLMVVLALFGNNLAKADALDSWTLRHADSSQFLTGISYGHGVYVATGQQGLIMTSPDGISWTKRNSGTTQWVIDVAWGNNIFVAVTQGGTGTILSSPDGINWTPRLSGTTVNYNRIRFLNGLFITIGYESTISTSTDGINWSTQHTGPDTHYNVNYGNGVYVIAGQLDPILISPDAINWSPIYLGQSYVSDVGFGNGVFLICSYQGLIMTSTNGIAWKYQTSSVPAPTTRFAAISYNQGTFVGCGGNGIIATSTDETDWTQRASGVSVNLWNVKYVNGTFVAVGEQGTILQTSNTLSAPPAQLTLLQTNRTPKTAEIGQPTIPTDTNHFKVFTNGAFHSGIALDRNKMTVVLTHGWNGSPSDWAEYTAQIIQQRIGANTVNIVAWDWSAEAQSAWYDLGIIAAKTPGQGFALGTNLLAALGVSYSQKIHFVGHSLGTLVNGQAAEYLHGHGFSWMNTQMTLCDEAEIAWGATSLDAAKSTLAGLFNDFSTSQTYWNHPLPTNCNWADNYISACGLLHPEAANVILTWEFPTSFPDFGTLKTEFYNFHDFAHYFYEDTIEPSIFNTGGQTNATYAGFICSFEGGGVANRPAPNTYFYQDPNGYELTLVQTNNSFATDFLNQRLRSYIGTLNSSGVSWVVDKAGDVVLQANGQVQGAIDYTGNLIINLFTGSGSPTPHGLVTPMGGPVPQGSPSANNSPAYAWIPLFIPSNAISMTFDFLLQGDGASDSFQVALNGTNVLSLETILIQTNVTLNSGMIDVSAYAGQTNEFFVGIVGGTSTNAQLTVQNLVFYSAPAPSLQAQSSGNNPVLTWPISATGFNLQTTTNLADPNSWVTLTNVPAIVNSQSTVTNSNSGGAVFYRLKK